LVDSKPSARYRPKALEVRTMTVGENIRRRREQLRMSQALLAQLTSASTDIIHRIEAGKTDATVSRLRAIAMALHCEPADLLDPEWGCPPPHPSFGEVG
jgi:transcriptional regulator with XRE-family HTH domain